MLRLVAALSLIDRRSIRKNKVNQTATHQPAPQKKAKVRLKAKTVMRVSPLVRSQGWLGGTAAVRIRAATRLSRLTNPPHVLVTYTSKGNDMVHGLDTLREINERELGSKSIPPRKRCRRPTRSSRSQMRSSKSHRTKSTLFCEISAG